MKEKGLIYEKKREETKTNESLPSPKEDKNLLYLKSRDPMKEFFILTAQAVKLNSPYMNTILSLHINQLYDQVNKSNTPFYKWSQWIEDYLHRTIISRIYSEAFQNKESRKTNQKMEQKSKENSNFCLFDCFRY